MLSTATPPLTLLLPWNLALVVALYGSGALLCRELAHRWGLGLPGLALLGAAYGVYEEALVDRFWFDPGYARATGVGGYSQVWHTNLLLAAHLTVFHSAVSVCSSVVVVTRLFPRERDRAWVGPRGLVLAGTALLLVLPLTAEDRVPVAPGPLVAAGGVGALLVVAAATVAHFALTYALPSTGLPWPPGLALAPVAVAVALLRRWTAPRARGREALWVVTGIVGPFVVLDALVGLGGRYDFTAAAALTALGSWWLHHRSRAPGSAARPPAPGAGGGDRPRRTPPAG